ncbi:hypothetical protein [Burkholderia seminalis]|uniref:Uncharacterized protein n=1 Tax=Burkholderia seminalis TaxID=488731 RepID=A0A8A8DET1_9BURK|nr:hypothetical protein [Burkholderia seminalis]MBJ9589303.1 hypothetical protein [Burkholderia seminalis]MCA8043683.1 hypothetical protein [Burkholderia seminalis]MDN7853123.1 hypothetical protein [Burkholderia seminalis]QTO23158.1 hypothetical protein DT99_034285 [Burkholderia seminalis]
MARNTRIVAIAERVRPEARPERQIHRTLQRVSECGEYRRPVIRNPIQKNLSTDLNTGKVRWKWRMPRHRLHTTARQKWIDGRDA